MWRQRLPRHCCGAQAGLRQAGLDALKPSATEQGYRFNEAETAKDGLRLAAAQPPDLIVLDLGLPDQNGLEVLRQIRDWSSVPIIIVSARGQEHDKVTALDLGANDYLTKPFGVGELLARIRVALRLSSKMPAEPVFATGDLRVDLVARRVWAKSQEVHLTPTEYRLLTTLIRDAGKVLTKSFFAQRSLGPRSCPGRSLPACCHGKTALKNLSGTCQTPDHHHRSRRRLPIDCDRLQLASVTAAPMCWSVGPKHVASHNCHIGDSPAPFYVTSRPLGPMYPGTQPYRAAN